MVNRDNDASPLLDIRHLVLSATVYPTDAKPHNVKIVDDVSFTLAQGKVLGLIGESGAGKSTIGLAAMAYGRGGVHISGGEVLLNGQNIAAASKKTLQSIRGLQVCYVSQSAAAGFNRLTDSSIR